MDKLGGRKVKGKKNHRQYEYGAKKVYQGRADRVQAYIGGGKGREGA